MTITYLCSWDDSRIRVLLHSKTYIGQWAWGKTKTVPIPGTDKVRQVPLPEDQWIIVPVPPIIDDELFHAAQRRMEENRRLNKRHKKYNYLFVGMLTCGNCKRAYHGGRWNDTAPYFYRCGGRRGKTRYIEIKCDMPNFTEDEIDTIVWSWIQEVVNDPGKVAEALEERQREGEEQNASILSLVRISEKLIDELKDQQARVMDLYKRNLLDAERWSIEDRELQHQIAEQEVQKAKLLGQVTVPLYSPEQLDDIRQACRWIAEGIEHMGRDEKREVYELLLFQGVIERVGDIYYLNVTCMLDARRLALRGSSNGGSEPSDSTVVYGKNRAKYTGQPVTLSVRLVLRRVA